MHDKTIRFPETKTLVLDQQGVILHVGLNRPEVRNAMSAQMVCELAAVFNMIKEDPNIRAVVLRGAGGSFCAGADISDMVNLRMQAMEQGNQSVYIQFNRSFGSLIDLVNQAPQVVVAVLEGAVLGGGLGLACVSDVALCLDHTTFGLPETGLGVIPAQIAPFIVQRIGLTQARRYALLGHRFDGVEAVRIGLVHQSFRTVDALEAALNELLQQVKRTAPNATRVTKSILHRAASPEPLDTLLDDVAVKFADAVNLEGAEGTLAFIEKRLPSWAQ